MHPARERAIRAAIRNFLYPLTEAQMMVELANSIERGDAVRTKYVNEYIEECRANDDFCEG
jgi:hypothetical protein